MDVKLDAADKASTRRELTLQELVIPDLQLMAASGKYDQNVLLWLQDAYVVRGMKDHFDELFAFHRDLATQTELTDDERWWCKVEFLGKITREVYDAEKINGDGARRPIEERYIDAARTFYQAESVVYAGQLEELAEYIKQALEAGVQPDLERFAREAYVSMSRMSDSVSKLEKLPNSNSQQMMKMMKQGIEAINYAVVATPGQPIPAGKMLLQIVNDIQKNPHRYIDFKQPQRTIRANPVSFEPARRNESAPGLD
jgi:hypothetical protein